MEAASKFLVLVCMFILMNLFESFYTILVGEKKRRIGINRTCALLESKRLES
jgi:hypothetical protein